jgi:simple sugar transport system substrate-binding protein
MLERRGIVFKKFLTKVKLQQLNFFCIKDLRLLHLKRKTTINCHFKEGEIMSKKIYFGIFIILLVIGFITGVAFTKLQFTFICHGGEENPFWATVYNGAVEAAKQCDVDFVMIRPENEADIASVLANFKATLSQKPDGIITTIPEQNMFDDVVKQALDMGIPVICANTDDPKKGEGNARLSYIGQDLEQAGYFLGQYAIKNLPEGEKFHFIIPAEAPGLEWAESRARGITRALEEAGHTYERLDATMQMDVAQSRIQAYLQSRPETKGVLCVGGIAPTGAAKAVKNLGKQPGEVIICGFDCLPEMLAEIIAGYIQFTVDQQPFLQGYLSVHQLYCMKTYGMSAWDVNTGNAVVDGSNAELILELSKKRLR